MWLEAGDGIFMRDPLPNSASHARDSAAKRGKAAGWRLVRWTPRGRCFGVRLVFPYGMTMLSTRRTHDLSNKLHKFNKKVELQIGV